MCVYAQVGKSATSYEPLSEVDVQNIDHQIKLYVNDAIPELEVCNKMLKVSPHVIVPLTGIRLDNYTHPYVVFSRRDNIYIDIDKLFLYIRR